MWIGNTSCLAKVRKTSTRANGISDPVLLAICFLTQPWHPHHFTAGPLSILPRIPFVAWHGPALKKKTSNTPNEWSYAWMIPEICLVGSWIGFAMSNGIVSRDVPMYSAWCYSQISTQCWVPWVRGALRATDFFSIAFPNITDLAGRFSTKKYLLKLFGIHTLQDQVCI